MRSALLSIVAAVFLAGCSTAGGSIVPLRAVGKASGDAEGPQVFLAGIPMNALVRIHGTVTYTVQAMPPYVTLDGDYTIIVEPLPGKEAEAQEAVTRGDMLIRRGGQPSNLNAPGSIRSFKAMRSRVYVPAARPVALRTISTLAEEAFCDTSDPTSPCHVPK